MGVPGEMTCPVCEEGVLSQEDWEGNSWSNRADKRALWSTPYQRLGKAFVYDPSEELDKQVWVIDGATFGTCGYQDIEIGLTIRFKRGSHHGGWTFYNFGDIAEFISKYKVDTIEQLLGKPVFTFWENGGGLGTAIRGVEVAEDLLL